MKALIVVLCLHESLNIFHVILQTIVALSFSWGVVKSFHNPDACTVI